MFTAYELVSKVIEEFFFINIQLIIFEKRVYNLNCFGNPFCIWCKHWLYITWCAVWYPSNFYSSLFLQLYIYCIDHNPPFLDSDSDNDNMLLIESLFSLLWCQSAYIFSTTLLSHIDRSHDELKQSDLLTE